MKKNVQFQKKGEPQTLLDITGHYWTFFPHRKSIYSIIAIICYLYIRVIVYLYYIPYKSILLLTNNEMIQLMLGIYKLIISPENILSFCKILYNLTMYNAP